MGEQMAPPRKLKELEYLRLRVAVLQVEYMRLQMATQLMRLEQRKNDVLKVLKLDPSHNYRLVDETFEVIDEGAGVVVAG